MATSASSGSLSLRLSTVLPPPPLSILTSASSTGRLCQALSARISGPCSQGSYIVVEATDKEAEQASHGTQGKRNRPGGYERASWGGGTLGQVAWKSLLK